jgi:phage replication O-like protein O
MANPQIEQGHIRIANVLWEALCHIPLSGLEYRVLFAIIRETWGWRLKERGISRKRISELTGIDNLSIISRICKLLEIRGIIKRIIKPGRQTIYAFNKDFEAWSSDPQVTSDLQVTGYQEVSGLSSESRNTSDPQVTSDLQVTGDPQVTGDVQVTSLENAEIKHEPDTYRSHVTKTTTSDPQVSGVIHTVQPNLKPCTTTTTTPNCTDLGNGGGSSGVLKLFTEEIGDPNPTIEKAIKNAVRHYGEDIVAGAIYEASEAGAEGWGLVAKILRDRKRDGALDELLDYLPDSNSKKDDNLGCPMKLPPELEFHRRSIDLQKTGLSMQDAMKQAHVEVYGFEHKSS